MGQTAGRSPQLAELQRTSPLCVSSSQENWCLNNQGHPRSRRSYEHSDNWDHQCLPNFQDEANSIQDSTASPTYNVPTPPPPILETTPFICNE